VKLKTLAAISLVVLGCSFASAQIGTFSFFSSAGTTAFCDFNVITYNSGGVVAGYDDLATDCGFAINAPIVGFAATTPALGLPAWGKGAVLGDALFDASEDEYTGLQWTRWQSDKPSKKSRKTGHFTGPYGWLGVAGTYSGLYFGDNYGYLGAGAPEKGEVAGHATSAGKLPEKLRK